MRIVLKFHLFRRIIKFKCCILRLIFWSGHLSFCTSLALRSSHNPESWIFILCSFLRLSDLLRFRAGLQNILKTSMRKWRFFLDFYFHIFLEILFPILRLKQSWAWDENTYLKQGNILQKFALRCPSLLRDYITSKILLKSSSQIEYCFHTIEIIIELSMIEKNPKLLHNKLHLKKLHHQFLHNS